MKNYLFIFIILALTSCHKTNIDGYYTGFEEMCSIDSTGKKVCYGDDLNPSPKWYHLSLIEIRDSKVFMDQSPVAVFKNDTTHSASDGGFYYYRGKSEIINSDSIVLNLIQVSCDYCAEPVRKAGAPIARVTKRLGGHQTNDGLLLNGILFKKSKTDKGLISEQGSSDK